MLVLPAILVQESEYLHFEQDKEEGLAGMWNFLCVWSAVSCKVFVCGRAAATASHS